MELSKLIIEFNLLLKIVSKKFRHYKFLQNIRRFSIYDVYNNIIIALKFMFPTSTIILFLKFKNF